MNRWFGLNFVVVFPWLFLSFGFEQLRNVVGWIRKKSITTIPVILLIVHSLNPFLCFPNTKFQSANPSRALARSQLYQPYRGFISLLGLEGSCSGSHVPQKSSNLLRAFTSPSIYSVAACTTYFTWRKRRGRPRVIAVFSPKMRAWLFSVGLRKVYFLFLLNRFWFIGCFGEDIALSYREDLRVAECSSKKATFPSVK